MRLILAVSAVSAALLCSGCGTVVGRQYPSLRPKETDSFYPATKCDLSFVVLGGKVIAWGNHGSSDVPPRSLGFVIVPLSLVDLPISLTTDTILLPLDLARWPAARRREEIEKERRSRVFEMAIGVQTTNAPGQILLDTSSRHDPNPPESPPWATFRNASSGTILKVTWPESFGFPDSPDWYRLERVFYDRVWVEKLKQRPDVQQSVGGDGKPAPQP
jgi:uncharacterized protein YceK